MSIKKNFSDWNKEELEDTFGLRQVRNAEILDKWVKLAETFTLATFEIEYLKHIREILIDNVDNWNEVELSEYFIGPVFTFVNFSTEKFNLFSERQFKATVGEYELSGEPDAVIAKGRRSPKLPYFCFHEYKKENEPKGDPAAQALAAMLAAQELNEHKFPVYGMYVVGRNWFFMFLKGKEFGITDVFSSTKDEIFDIVKMLKALKNMIIDL